LPQDLADEELKLDRREGEKVVGMSKGETTDGGQCMEAFGPIGSGKGLEEEREGMAGQRKRKDVGRGEVLDEDGREGRRRNRRRLGYIQEGGGCAGRPGKTTAEWRRWKLWRRSRRRRRGRGICDEGCGCQSFPPMTVLIVVVTPLDEAFPLQGIARRRGDRTMPRRTSLLLLLRLLLLLLRLR
jgi:hypothetical protein